MKIVRLAEQLSLLVSAIFHDIEKEFYANNINLYNNITSDILAGDNNISILERYLVEVAQEREEVKGLNILVFSLLLRKG